MRFAALLLVSAGLLAGCNAETPKPSGTPAKSGEAAAGGSKSGAEKPTPAADASKPTEKLESPANLTPVKIESGTATLSPENTKILFVATHAGPKPDPMARTGGFAAFSGKAEIDADAKMLKSISLDIDTESVWTAQAKLTDHLKGPDFLDAKEQPKATFESTGIAAGEAGAGLVTISGKFTLHGVTKEISVPAVVKLTDAGLTLFSKFTINRTDYGIKFPTDKVDDVVSLTFTIGEKTDAK